MDQFEGNWTITLPWLFVPMYCMCILKQKPFYHSHAAFIVSTGNVVFSSP